MAEEIRWSKTHCARMDHGGCALMVGVEENRIVKIKGDPQGYLNKGYTCYKGRVSADRLTHPDRLRYPLKRAGKRGEGKWQRVSWEEALDETAKNLLQIKEKYGARAVGFGVGMPKGLEHFVLIRLANIFGSPNVRMYATPQGRLQACTPAGFTRSPTSTTPPVSFSPSAATFSPPTRRGR